MTNVKRCIGLLLCTFVIFGGCKSQVKSVAADETITIARDGSSKAVIVVDSEAPEPVRHAAAELSGFLNRITAGTFDIVSQPSADKTNILVGPRAAKIAEPDFTADGLGSDGIIIRTKGKDLILAGGHPRGTLYAVYFFLEEKLGCRWWSSTASTIPNSPTIRVGKLDVRYVPPLEYREPYWFDAFDGDWALRNKCNGNSARLDKKRGGKLIYQGFVHTFHSLIPPEKYFDKHPEWYSLIDGKRKKDAQLCLTNEQMRKELVKNLKERLHNNPDATIASVSQNDGWAGNCQCPQCKEVEDKEGSPAGLMLQFVNAVAADIELDFPNVAIDTLAYTYTKKPPKHIRPRHNVIVRLCNYKSSFCKPLTDECNKDFHDDIINWSKICSRIYIWNYVTNFAHYVQPHPNLRVLGPNIKFFAANNVKGIFEQGAYQSDGAEMAELRAWVIAKMLWNPALDSRKLIDEFVAGFYGPAGMHVKSYLDLIHDSVEKSGDWLGCYSPPDANFLSFDVLAEGTAHLNDARRAVKDNPELLKRIDLARLPMMYVFIVRWNELRDKAEADNLQWPIQESIDDVFNEFKRIADENKITNICETKHGLGHLENIVRKTK